MSLHLLTRRFLRLMQEAPGCSVDLTHVTTRLQTHRRRLYDITSTLYGIQVIEKESKNRVRWMYVREKGVSVCTLSRLLLVHCVSRDVGLKLF